MVKYILLEISEKLAKDMAIDKLRMGYALSWAKYIEELFKFRKKAKR